MTSPGGSGRPLVAVLLPRRAAAAAVATVWDAAEAVTVLDPAAPAAVLRDRLEALRPTHVLDHDGRRALPDGAGVDESVAAVVSTSGTTGPPRGIELTRVGMESMGRGVTEAIGVQPDDRWLCCLPLHHVAGLAILARGRVAGVPVLVHDDFDLDEVARAPSEHGTTIVSLVPTMLRRLLDAGAPLDRYRTLLLGGAALPRALRERAEHDGAHVVATYGMSETWGGCVHDGTAQRGVAFRLGRDGEVQLRGRVVTRGYRFDDAATGAAFTADGWFRTGDLGAVDDAGRLRVVDRMKELIVSGGVNVSPVHVEHVLADHPGVADVVVVGVTDPEWGERVVARIVPVDADEPPTLEELRSFAGDRLSAPELPRGLAVVDELPRTPTGKLRRR